jgi:hypothetical protein
MLVVSGDEGWVKTQEHALVAMLVGERYCKGQRCCRDGAAILNGGICNASSQNGVCITQTNVSFDDSVSQLLYEKK